MLPISRRYVLLVSIRCSFDAIPPTIYGMPHVNVRGRHAIFVLPYACLPWQRFHLEFYAPEDALGLCWQDRIRSRFGTSLAVNSAAIEEVAHSARRMTPAFERSRDR